MSTIVPSPSAPSSSSSSTSPSSSSTSPSSSSTSPSSSSAASGTSSKIPTSSYFSKGHVDLLSCGFLSGVLQAIIFNPWDRALYLSVKNERHFLDKANFEAPMRGMFQTLIQRAVSSGLYFPLEDIFHEEILARFGHKKEYRTLQNFAAGTMAGCMNAVLMNPASSVKYHYWGEIDRENFISTAKEMFRKGGIRPFFVGSSATLARDIIFGGTYALLRHELHVLAVHHKYAKHVSSFATLHSSSSSSSVNNSDDNKNENNSVVNNNSSISSSGNSSNSSSGSSSNNNNNNNNSKTNNQLTSDNTNNILLLSQKQPQHHQHHHHHQQQQQHYQKERRKLEAMRFIINMFSACTATILSSPFNYIRNIHYSTPPDKNPGSFRQILTDLYHQSMNKEKGVLGVGRIRYLLARLRIGWGTARVGVGMAFGSEFYSYCSQVINHNSNSNHSYDD